MALNSSYAKKEALASMRSPSRIRSSSSLSCPGKKSAGAAGAAYAAGDEEADGHFLGRASCACCLKTGHATWYPRPPPETLRLRLQLGREGCELLCAACDRSNKVKLAREKELEKLEATDPMMRTPARKKGERPRMVICAICSASVSRWWLW